MTGKLAPQSVSEPSAGRGDTSTGLSDTGDDIPDSWLVADVVRASEDDAAWSGAAWPDTSGAQIDEAIAIAVKAIATWPRLLPQPSEATIALLSDDEVARLNGQFRGQSKPTNVLSFPAEPLDLGSEEPDGDRRRMLGDIALAEATILREALDLEIDPTDHLKHLVVHGLLHLLGHDHMTDAEADAMESLETAILASIGVPDPYAGTEPAVALSVTL